MLWAPVATWEKSSGNLVLSSTTECLTPPPFCVQFTASTKTFHYFLKKKNTMSKSFGFLDSPKIIINGLWGIWQSCVAKILIEWRFWAFPLKLCVYLRLTRFRDEAGEEVTASFHSISKWVSVEKFSTVGLRNSGSIFDLLSILSFSDNYL